MTLVAVVTGRLERDRRGDRPPARRASPAPRSCSSRGARTACARWPRELGGHRDWRRRPHRRRRSRARARARARSTHDRLDLLVNNAGAAWRATFADGGWENVKRHMAVNFDAVVRLTEALLPLLRRSGPERDRQRLEHRGPHRAPGLRRLLGEQVRARGLVRRADRRGGAPTASTSGSCCRASSRPRASPSPSSTTTRSRAGSSRRPERGAEAIVDAGLNGKAERYVPRPYAARRRAARAAAGPGPPRDRRQGRRAAGHPHRQPRLLTPQR